MLVHRRRVRLGTMRQLLSTVAAVCVFTLGCAGSTATLTTNPLSIPRMSRAEAIAFIKTYWDKDASPAERQAPPGDIAWRYYADCVAAHSDTSFPDPQSAEVNCDFYSSMEDARDGMESMGNLLTSRGSWTAGWEPSSRSWVVRGQIQAFPWTFRVFETSLTVELLPHPVR